MDEGDSAVDDASIRVRWTENPEGIEQRVPLAASEGKDLIWLDFRNERGEDDYMAVRQDSALGELQRLASRLAEQFPWREVQATWFILTGEPRSCLRSKCGTHCVPCGYILNPPVTQNALPMAR